MSTDRELLELAAKAEGISFDSRYTTISPCGRKVLFCSETGPGSEWSPLLNDGDALRLAAKLEIDIEFGIKTIWANAGHRGLVGGDYSGDPCESLRRAITGAAAEIGRTMP